MTAPELNNLRALLDEYEHYANSARSSAGKAGTANEILAAVAEARAALLPSGDSTANFIDVKQVVERLAALRAQAEGPA